MLRRRSYYTIISLVIIGFWLIMGGLLVRREFFGPRLNVAAARRALEPTETWMGLFTPGEKQIGYLNVRTTPERRDGVPGIRMAMNAELSMALLGQPTEILMVGSGWSPLGDGATAFDVRLQSGEHRIRIAGTADGGMLDAVVHTGGEAVPFQLPVREDFTLWDSLAPAFDVSGMKPGKTYTAPAFDPVTMSMGRAQVTYVGEDALEIGGERIQTTVVALDMSGFTSKAWITAENEVVRAETPFGFTLMKIPPAQATVSASEDATADLITMSAVMPSGKAVERGATRMVVALDGFPPTVQVPTDDTQRAAGDGLYEIVRAGPPRQPVVPVGDQVQAFIPHLESDAFIQAGHPDIRQAAAGIVRGETDPWKQALLLYDWVFENIEKAAVFSVPSALDVLATREGDCNEHTVLFAALARAAGIPTRIAIGVVWSETYGAFYYHAWPEVYLGRWIWMDPTLGQPIADATHIKLIAGGIDKWFRLVSYLGNLEIHVRDIEYEPRAPASREQSAAERKRCGLPTLLYRDPAVFSRSCLTLPRVAVRLHAGGMNAQGSS